MNALIKSAKRKWELFGLLDSLRSLLHKGNPRRIFAGKFSRDGTRVIRTARNAPERRQKVNRRKRVLVARRQKVAGIVGTVVRLSLVAIAAGFIAVDVYGYMHSSPRFSVTHIAVEGNIHVTALEVIARSGIAEGQNIFDISLGESAEAIREIPWVLDARVRRHPPGQITIDINERTPVALVPAGELLLMDDTGRIVAGLNAAENVDAPFITSSKFGRLKPGDVVQTEGIAKALEIIRLMNSMGIAHDIVISEISIDDPRNIVLIAGRSGANIFLGNDDLEGKLWRLGKVVRAIGKNGGRKIADLKKMDLRFGAIVPTRIEGD
jgi:cell division protein FtsQ